MDVSGFRQTFPAFSDATRHTTAQINFWAALADKTFSEATWGDVKPLAVQLFVAHNLTLAPAPGKAGLSTGLATSKSVGEVSVSYDVKAGVLDGAGRYGLTTYGTQLYEMIRMFGAGGLQL